MSAESAGGWLGDRSGYRWHVRAVAGLLLLLVAERVMAQQTDTAAGSFHSRRNAQVTTWQVGDLPQGDLPQDPQPPAHATLPLDSPAELPDNRFVPLGQPESLPFVVPQPSGPVGGRPGAHWDDSWVDDMELYLQRRARQETDQLGRLKSELQRLQRSLTAERVTRSQREREYRDKLIREQLRRELLMSRIRDQVREDSGSAAEDSAAEDSAAEGPDLPPQPAVGPERSDTQSDAGSDPPPAARGESAGAADSTGDSAGPIEPTEVVADRALQPGSAVAENPATMRVEPQRATTLPTSVDAVDEQRATGLTGPLSKNRPEATERAASPQNSGAPAADVQLNRLVEGAVDRVAFADNLFAAGRTEEALKVYRRLWDDYPAEKKPDSESLWYEFQMAACYRRMGEVQQASQLLQRVAGSGKTDAELSEYARWWISTLKTNARLQQGLTQVAAIVKTLEEGPK